MDDEKLIALLKEAGAVVYEGHQDRIVFDGSIMDVMRRFAELVRDDALGSGGAEGKSPSA